MSEELRGKIFWHGAFFEALQFELRQYKDFLQFYNEHRLSKEALSMDVLVIKKNKGVHIEKNIGRIFRGVNIFEFKSEADSFSLWDYSKVFGYAYLYSSFEQVPVSDITVSIALTIFPRELMKSLESERGIKARDLGDGIYYIDGEVFPVQILESKKLSPDSNVFLRNIRSNLSKKDISNLLKLNKEYNFFSDKSVYLDRLAKANPVAFKEAVIMTEAVMELILESAEEYGWKDRIVESAEKNGWLDDVFVKIKEGYEQDKKEIAKKMLTRGDTVDDVAEITKLPIETVGDLLADVRNTNS